ncbi:MAG: sugar ABC transporter ATP-binding protein [Actinobacteria bacterium]|nr:sugar ABC transporter ATP-binding protein [Actinomycetota bacterium]
MNLQAPALDLSGISKSYPGARALDDVSLRLMPGEVHALVGENGAGKSTLIKIASGAIQADSGTVSVDGSVVANASRRAFQALGIRVIYQERQIARDLSVGENVMLDRLPGTGLVSWRRTMSEASERLAVLGLELDPRSSVRGLSVAQWQLIEIARAVDYGARAIIMDEPTASLSRVEVERLFDVVNALRARGVAVLYISHHLDEIFHLADTVTVLRDGRQVFNGAVAGLTPDQLVNEMFGEVSHTVDRTDSCNRDGGPAISLVDVHAGTRVRGVSCEIYPGEVVGFTGGTGSGTTELAALLVGARRPSSGSVVLGGGRRLRSRTGAASAVAFLPSDRKRRGLLLDKTIADNLLLGRLAVPGPPVVMPRRQRKVATMLMKAANVKSDSADRGVRTLSGGNQQKVIIGRWMEVGTPVLVFDEPTAGIDIPSKMEIYATLRRLANEGAAIVVCSTDFQEVGLVTDRVFVMRDGRIVGEVAGALASEQRLIEMEMSA